jgi:hypothetical protein
MARALSSAGERSLHTGEVVGSIPTAPTSYPFVSGHFEAVYFDLDAIRNGTERET